MTAKSSADPRVGWIVVSPDWIQTAGSSAGMKLWSGPGSFSSPLWMMKFSGCEGSASWTVQYGP